MADPTDTLAHFQTSLGDFTAKIFVDETPIAAKNFIDLAEGTKAWNDPATGSKTTAPLYNGRKIFRVMRGFMFQTGSANDTGSYDVGYTIPDEIRPDLRFDRAGRLAMANRGPNTSGCQFFVTFGKASHLSGGYTIFGEVIDGMETIRKIEAVEVRVAPQGEQSMPVDMPVIHRVTIQHPADE